MFHKREILYINTMYYNDMERTQESFNKEEIRKCTVFCDGELILFLFLNPLQLQWRDYDDLSDVFNQSTD